MNNEGSVDSQSGVEFDHQLHKVQKLLQANRLAQAEAAIDRLLAASPAHAEAQFTRAVIKRLLKKDDAALTALDRLHQVSPNHSRGYQEKGFIWMARKNLRLATASFEKAVELDPALITSWKALRGLYQLGRDRVGLAGATRRLEELRSLPPELLSVSTLINENRLDKAESRCRQFLRENPENVEAMRLLARIGSEVGIFDDAELLLQRALELRPDFHAARFDYVGVLQKRQKFFRAYEEAGALLSAMPHDYNYLRLYGNTCINVDRNEEAIRIYHDVLAVDPENPRILLMCGHAARTIGRVDEAIGYYQRSYSARPEFGDAFWSLANLKTYTLTEKELKTASQSEAAATTSTDDRIHLNFALGKAYEDYAEIELAFKHYERGNRLKLEETGYQSKQVSNEVDAQIEVCSVGLFRDRQGWGHTVADPIFIVGLPRAGSTLLEQILASHSKVDGTRELPNVLQFVAQLNGRRMRGEEAKYPGVLSELTDSEIAEFGRRYIEETRYHRAGAPYFTDKMPNNFRHIGFIKMILPNAKIIDARRDPMACCWSAYKQLFAAGQMYTYGLEEVGRYYRDYLRLMAHWNVVFPGQILKVQYEDVVGDVETQVGRILAFCGLEMEQACLEFYNTKRCVNTPSSEQVRQPIYREAVDHWRKFEAHLQPLKAALGV